MTNKDVKLDVYQALWSMLLRRPDGVERPIEQCFEMVGAAGFDGMCIDLGVTDMASARKCRDLFTQNGLGCLLTAFVKKIDDLPPVLDLAQELGAKFVNIIGQVMPLGVDATVPVVRRWMEMADRAGVEIQFETHRNSITNDLFATLQLLDAVPEMTVSADLSHYLVGREIEYPPSPASQEHIRRILTRAQSFQGRVASRQQIQVPLAFPHNRKWVDLFLGWWETGFAMWLKQNPEKKALNFLCELGPSEYAMTGPDGYELSDRWEESLMMKDMVQDIWKRLAA
ncbi:MAG: sugar phosphate isomerase/epimerase [Parvibaculaceae bacterium]|nr:sugar phosphate isomerase/epimerase [Parvibaculaceae bacterium]